MPRHVLLVAPPPPKVPPQKKKNAFVDNIKPTLAVYSSYPEEKSCGKSRNC